MKETSSEESEIRAVLANRGASGGCKDDFAFVEKFRILGLLLIRKKGLEEEEEEAKEKPLLNLKLQSISKALLPIF